MRKDIFWVKLLRLAPALIAGATAFAPLSLMAASAQAPTEQTPLFGVNPNFQNGTARYVNLAGEGFTFERVGSRAYMQFDNDEEVWALKATVGQRGDEFLKNDAGRLFLRMTEVGGVILYHADAPRGEPVARENVNPASLIPPDTEEAGFEGRLSAYLTLRLGKEISVQALPAGEAETKWYQDAAGVVAKAMVKAEKHTDNVRQVRIVRGDVPDFKFNDAGVLTIYVDPKSGYFGRPSSDRVIRFLINRVSS